MTRDTYLSNQEAANYLDLSTNTLNYWRHVNRGPRYTKLGNRIKYRLADLDAFARMGAVETSESGEEP